MPFRVGEDWPGRAKIQFTTGNWMPAMIYRACLATGVPSNAVYCQRAVSEALARDLGLDLDELIGRLPPARGPSAHLYDPDEATMSRFKQRRIGPANTVEEVV